MTNPGEPDMRVITKNGSAIETFGPRAGHGGEGTLLGEFYRLTDGTVIYVLAGEPAPDGAAPAPTPTATPPPASTRRPPRPLQALLDADPERYPTPATQTRPRPAGPGQGNPLETQPGTPADPPHHASVMHETQHLDTPEHLRALSDPSRVAILRRLMARPATITQLGALFDKHPAWIRHHVLQLQHAGLVELAEERKVGGYTEKYYRATAESFTFATMLLPDPGERGLVVVVGSDDPAVHLLAERVRSIPEAPLVFTLATGSLEGLIALRQGVGDAAGCHLLDPETGQYNAPYAQRFFPGRTVSLVTLADREQGLLVAPGNPLRLVARSKTSPTAICVSSIATTGRERASGSTEASSRAASSLTTCGAMILSSRPTTTSPMRSRAAARTPASASAPPPRPRTRLRASVRGALRPRHPLPSDVSSRRCGQSSPNCTSASIKVAVRDLGGYATDHTGDETIVAA